MKTQRFFFVPLILICVATISLATTVADISGKMIVHMNLDGTHSIDLQIANLQQYRTGVFLTDFNGKVWYSEYVWNENGYAKSLDLEGMPEGDYVLFVKNRYNKFVQVLAVQSKGITLFDNPNYPKGASSAIFASNPSKVEGSLITYFYAPGDYRIGIQVANLRGEKLTVQLNTLRSLVAFRECVEDIPAYAKYINMEGMDTGDYYMILRTEEMVQIQFFTLHKEGIELESIQTLDNRREDDAFAGF